MTSFRKIFFQFLGVVAIVSAGLTFYFFGKELLPLFKSVVGGEVDAFLIFLVLSTFFFGTPALLMVGFRLLYLRSFSRTWLYYLALPVTAGIYMISNIDTIYDMDALMSSVVFYIFVYASVFYILRFIRREWYVSISHEKLHHVGLVQDGKPKKGLHTLLVITALAALLFAHPSNITDTIQMLFSPVTRGIEFLMGSF